MPNYPATPREMLQCLWRHRGLIHASTKREVLSRYRGSIFGLFWSFFNPLCMLAIYTFVFSEVFKARWSSGSDSKTEFALLLFAGLIIFNLFAECINRAPGLILANTNYVKKVIYPLEILPFVGLLTAMYHAAISLGVWLVAYVIFFGMPHVTALLLPIALMPLIFFIMGLSWWLASLGVYIRDASHFIGVFTTVLTFLSPIFYPVNAFPAAYRHLLYLNPLTPIIEQTRGLLYFGIGLDFKLIMTYWTITFIIAWIGFFWFQKTRKGFADVL